LSCEEARTLVHAYLDGELDVRGSLEFEAHLQECEACTREYRGQRSLREGIAASPLYYQAPAGLRKSIQSAVRQESKAAAPRRRLPWQLLSLGFVLVLLVATAYALLRNQASSDQTNLVAQEVISGHMRSLMAGHLTDVASSDQHTVKPWFAGRLDFSPVVGDWAAQGFPLVGGRLDYVNNRPVAALVYRNRQHVINLFTWPSPQTPNAPVEQLTYQGYNLYRWTQSGMTYWVVSDLNPVELRKFVDLVQKAAPTPAPGG
jgi:anti-sigma factor RsiW